MTELEKMRNLIGKEETELIWENMDKFDYYVEFFMCEDPNALNEVSHTKLLAQISYEIYKLTKAVEKLGEKNG